MSHEVLAKQKDVRQIIENLPFLQVGSSELKEVLCTAAKKVIGNVGENIGNVTAKHGGSAVNSEMAEAREEAGLQIRADDKRKSG